MENARHKHNKWWAIAIGTGIALSPIHNQWLTNLATNNRGEVLFFLPAFGYLLMIMGTGLFILNNWKQVKEVGWGDKRVAGCLLYIVLAIALSGANYEGIEAKIAPLGMGLSLFGIYLASRILGKELFKPLAIGAAIASIGIIAYKFQVPEKATGGYIFEYNYDIATGYILLGIALFAGKWQWVLVILGVTALLLSGSAEAIFSIGVVGTLILIHNRKKLRFSYKVAVAAVAISITAGIFFGLGYGQETHRLSIWALTGEEEYIPEGRRIEGGSPLIRRIHTIKEELSDLQPLGIGYIVTDFSRVKMVHNVPLVIVQQLGWVGIMASIAWLWVGIYYLKRSRWKWKYAWATLFTLCIFDHYIWTQLAPLWWAIAGASSIEMGEDNEPSTKIN